MTTLVDVLAKFQENERELFGLAEEFRRLKGSYCASVIEKNFAIRSIADEDVEILRASEYIKYSSKFCDEDYALSHEFSELTGKLEDAFHTFMEVRRDLEEKHEAISAFITQQTDELANANEEI